LVIKLKKITLTRFKKKLSLSAAVIIIGAAIFLIFKILTPIREEEELTLYSYTMKAGCNYEIYLIENEIYNRTVLGESLVYPKSIMDKFKINFYAEFIGHPAINSDIRADYIIEVIVRGFQTINGEKRIVYEETFPITSKSGMKFTDQAFLSEEVYLDMNQYESFVNKVKSILQADPENEAELIFRGMFESKTEYGNKEEKFAYSMALPLFQILFSIDKPADIEKTGSITEKRLNEKTIDRFILIVPCIIILIMLLLIVYIVKYSIPPSEEENLLLHFKSIMRKHGSRIIRVSRSENISFDRTFEIKDIEGMIKISDQYSIPVFYVADEGGLPEENKFFIPGKEFCYIYYLTPSNKHSPFYYLSGNQDTT